MEPGAAVAAIDSRRFEALLGQARETVGTNPTKASELCHRALDLWRGQALADFSYEEFVQAEGRRPDEVRLAAIELRIEAHLAAGHDAHLVPELESLVIEHPLRENLWSQLMLILYRTGRQPEALRAYQRAREVFGDLGTEPSDDLAALEKKILLRDPTLMPEAQPVQGNLPATVSSFVGRGAEMTQIRDLVLANRLVSIVGTGGVGKTRLAIETARGLVDEFPDGVWLVEYAGIDDPEMVPSQVASTLGMPAGGHNALDDVTDHLSTTEALIIVDNCEHLADSIGRMVSTFLTHCPLLRVLATSRRPLAVQGEMMWGAAPLSLRAGDTPGDQPEALRMFLERARAAKPDLALTDEVEKAAAEACTRLAGLPLAIELAAARLRVMSVAQLSNRLDDAFALLTGGPKDKPDHQRGLRALLDWSYDLLAPEEQQLFRLTSVFRGGFSLESAERLAELAEISTGDALDHVGALVDMSLVSLTADERYLMLELIREYGLLLLDGHAETEAARDLHLPVLRETLFVPETIVAPMPFEIPGVFSRFAAEIDNARAPIAWALDRGDRSAALELGPTVCQLLRDHGLLIEAHDLSQRLLEETSEPSAQRAKLLRDAVYGTATLEGLDDAMPLVDELAATAEALDDDTWRALTISRRGALEFLRGDSASAIQLWEDAADRLVGAGSDLAWKPLAASVEAAIVTGNFDLARRLSARMDGDEELPNPVSAWFLGSAGFAAAAAGDADAAEEIFERYAARPSPGELQGMSDREAHALTSLARMDLDDVEQWATAMLEQGRTNLSQWELYLALVLLGVVHFHRGDKVVARRYFAEGLVETTRLKLRPWQLWFLLPHAATFADGAPDKCVSLLAAIEAAGRDRWGPFGGVAKVADQAAAEARSMLTPDEIAQVEARGAVMALDEAIELALSSD